MWTMLLALWSLPIAAAILLLARVREGGPALTDEESRSVFGDRKTIDVSLPMVLEFLLVALLFFMIGVFDGLVLANFGTVSRVLFPLLTSLAILSIPAYCLRFPPRETRLIRLIRRKVANANLSQSRIADLLQVLNFRRR